MGKENIKKIVNPDNTVNFGTFNERLDLNFEDYRTCTFFNKLKSKSESLKALKKFNYYSFVSQNYVISVGFVNLGSIYNCFAYVYARSRGIIYNKQFDILGKEKVKYLGDNYEFSIDWKKSDDLYYKLIKTINGTIDLDFNLKDELKLKTTINIPNGYKRHIVCNPADFTKWTFTEKMCCLPCKSINAFLNNNQILTDEDIKHTYVSSDWSAGFFRRETNWLWAAASGKVDKHNIGFNFTILINDALYPENALWFDHQKIQLPRVLFECNYLHPEKNPIKVFTNDKMVDLTFTIFGVKEDIANRFNIVKTNFRQYIGRYSGTIVIKDRKYQIKDLVGFFEVHKSIW